MIALLFVSVVSLFGFYVVPVEAQDVDSAPRIHMLTVSTPESGALTSLAMTLNRTVAVKLKSRGVDVTELSSDSWKSVDEYLRSQEPGSFDRLIALSFGQVGAGVSVQIDVIDPLSGEITLSLQERARRPIQLFGMADGFVSKVFAEVSDVRIAFGRIIFTTTEWSDANLGNIPWEHAVWVRPEAIEGAIRRATVPVENLDFELTAGSDVYTFRDRTILQLPAESVDIRVTQKRLEGRETIFSGTFDVKENATVDVAVEIPLLSQSEHDQFVDYLRRLDSARQAALAARDDESIDTWLKMYDELGEYAASLKNASLPGGAVVPFIEHAAVAAQIDAIRVATEAKWQSPEMDALIELVGLSYRAKSTAALLPDDPDVRLSVDARAMELGEDIVKLAELEMLRDMSRRDWKGLEDEIQGLVRQVEATTYPVPPWLDTDVRRVDEIFDRYRTEDAGRYGLYGSLSLGGTILMVTGATLFTSGVWTALQNETDRDDPNYGSAFSISPSFSQAQQSEGGVLRLVGIGSAAVGLTSFLASPIIQGIDRVSRADRLLRARLKSYFEPRMEVNNALRRGGSGRNGTIDLPLPNFE